MIIPKKILSMFPLGVINFHFGDLPMYSGSNTIQWTLLNNEKKTAVSVHYVNEKVDSGPLICKSTINISNNDTSFSIQKKLIDSMIKLFVRKFYKIDKFKFLSKHQNISLRVVWPRRTPLDSKIDWNSFNDDKISLMSRALVKPWPLPYYFDLNKKKKFINRPLNIIEVRKLRKNIKA